MAKIDTVIHSLQAGFQNPEFRMGTSWVPDEQMEALQVRRRKADQAQHRLTYLVLGEAGQNPPAATFWGHEITDVIKKALAWRGMPTKGTRGPRKKSA